MKKYFVEDRKDYIFNKVIGYLLLPYNFNL